MAGEKKTKRRKRIKRKTVVAVGAFRYDLFPYIVIQGILDWEENGDIVTDIGTYNASALISVFPKNIKNELYKKINEVKQEYQNELTKLKEGLLTDLYTSFPNLRAKMN